MRVLPLSTFPLVFPRIKTGVQQAKTSQALEGETPTRVERILDFIPLARKPRQGSSEAWLVHLTCRREIGEMIRARATEIETITAKKPANGLLNRVPRQAFSTIIFEEGVLRQHSQERP